MGARSRRDIVYLVLTGFFVTNAILGELTGGKLFTLGPFTLSIGVIPWPVVFIATDLINEYFGREGVKRLTFITIGLIVYAFVVLFLAMQVPAASFSPALGNTINLAWRSPQMATVLWSGAKPTA